MHHPECRPLAELVDLKRYPIDALEGDEGQRLVARCRAALDELGCIVLPDFVAPDALAQMAAEARQVADQAYFNDIRTNPYSSEDDPSLPPEHPVRLFGVRTNGFVGGDLLPSDSAIRELYRSAPLIAFLAACMRLERLYVYADPIADAVVNVLRPGCQFPWHFDNNDYTITILTQTPESGGVFEFCPNIRSATAQNFEAVGEAIRGRSALLRQLTLRPGDLQIFYGRNSLHRVTPIEGARERHSVIYAYVEDPLRIGGVERTRRIYGRVHARHLAEAERARTRDAL